MALTARRTVAGAGALDASPAAVAHAAGTIRIVRLVLHVTLVVVAGGVRALRIGAALTVAQTNITFAHGDEAGARLIALLEHVVVGAAPLPVTTNVFGAGPGGSAAGFTLERAVGFRVAGPIVLARLQNIAFTLERVGQAQSAVWTLTQIAMLDRGTFFGFDLEQRGGTRLSRSAVAERIVRRASNAIF